MDKKDGHTPAQPHSHHPHVQSLVRKGTHYNAEELFTMSILKGKEFNESLILQKKKIKEMLKSQERQIAVAGKQLDATNQQFPPTIPLMIKDEHGNTYFHENNNTGSSLQKATISQFIALNVQQEHNNGSKNDPSGSNAYGRNMGQKARRRRKKKNSIRPDEPAQTTKTN